LYEAPGSDDFTTDDQGRLDFFTARTLQRSKERLEKQGGILRPLQGGYRAKPEQQGAIELRHRAMQ
jgi:hypothetical protein